ncbi:MAG: DUF4405 domain-containing protein [Cyanothece sp. SIO1E1]|nr:DUF4405 domain-containing protein [Cyanothece sp. SIO1E1]
MKRSFVSQLIAVLFFVLAFTGILMYINPFSKATTVLHITTGFLFIIGIGFHLVNNIKALFNYIKGPKKRKTYLNPAFLGMTIGVLLLVGISKFDLPPLKQLYALGEHFQGNTEVHYKLIQTNTDLAGQAIGVEVLMGKPSHTPTLAIWVEDAQGNYLQDLYVSQKLAQEKFINFQHKRRPEALPVWSHRRAVKAADGLFVPDQENPIADGMTGATPTTSWILQSQLDSPADSVRIFMEINQSFDWNSFYHPEAFPDDPIYSGPGKVGQPALIYGTKVISLEDAGIEKMQLLGRAHHSGQDGEIHTDLEQMTTALDMVDRVLVEVPEMKAAGLLAQ